MRKRLAIAGAAVALLVAAFVAGRWSAPAPRVEDSAKVEAKSDAKGAGEEKRNEGTKTDTARVVIVRKRPATSVAPGCPPCAPIEETETRENIHAQTFDLGTLRFDWAQTSEQKSETKHASDPARPSWRIGATTGWSSLTPKPDLYGLELSRRVVGPIWLGIEARTDKTATVGVALEF